MGELVGEIIKYAPMFRSFGDRGIHNNKTACLISEKTHYAQWLNNDQELSDIQKLLSPEGRASFFTLPKYSILERNNWDSLADLWDSLADSLEGSSFIMGLEFYDSKKVRAFLNNSNITNDKKQKLKSNIIEANKIKKQILQEYLEHLKTKGLKNNSIKHQTRYKILGLPNANEFSTELSDENKEKIYQHLCLKGTGIGFNEENNLQTSKEAYLKKDTSRDSRAKQVVKQPKDKVKGETNPNAAYLLGIKNLIVNDGSTNKEQEVKDKKKFAIKYLEYFVTAGRCHSDELKPSLLRLNALPTIEEFITEYDYDQKVFLLKLIANAKSSLKEEISQEVSDGIDRILVLVGNNSGFIDAYKNSAKRAYNEIEEAKINNGKDRRKQKQEQQTANSTPYTKIYESPYILGIEAKDQQAKDLVQKFTRKYLEYFVTNGERNKEEIESAVNEPESLFSSIPNLETFTALTLENKILFITALAQAAKLSEKQDSATTERSKQAFLNDAVEEIQRSANNFAGDTSSQEDNVRFKEAFEDLAKNNHEKLTKTSQASTDKEAKLKEKIEKYEKSMQMAIDQGEAACYTTEETKPTEDELEGIDPVTRYYLNSGYITKEQALDPKFKLKDIDFKKAPITESEKLTPNKANSSQSLDAKTLIQEIRQELTQIAKNAHAPIGQAANMVRESTLKQFLQAFGENATSTSFFNRLTKNYIENSVLTALGEIKSREDCLQERDSLVAQIISLQDQIIYGDIHVQDNKDQYFSAEAQAANEAGERVSEQRKKLLNNAVNHLLKELGITDPSSNENVITTLETIKKRRIKKLQGNTDTSTISLEKTGAILKEKVNKVQKELGLIVENANEELKKQVQEQSKVNRRKEKRGNASLKIKARANIPNGELFKKLAQTLRLYREVATEFKQKYASFSQSISQSSTDIKTLQTIKDQFVELETKYGLNIKELENIGKELQKIKKRQDIVWPRRLPNIPSINSYELLNTGLLKEAELSTDKATYLKLINQANNIETKSDAEEWIEEAQVLAKTNASPNEKRLYQDLINPNSNSSYKNLFPKIVGSFLHYLGNDHGEFIINTIKEHDPDSAENSNEFKTLLSYQKKFDKAAKYLNRLVKQRRSKTFTAQQSSTLKELEAQIQKIQEECQKAMAKREANKEIVASRKFIEQNLEAELKDLKFSKGVNNSDAKLQKLKDARESINERLKALYSIDTSNFNSHFTDLIKTNISTLKDLRWLSDQSMKSWIEEGKAALEESEVKDKRSRVALALKAKADQINSIEEAKKWTEIQAETFKEMGIEQPSDLPKKDRALYKQHLRGPEIVKGEPKLRGANNLANVIAYLGLVDEALKKDIQDTDNAKKIIAIVNAELEALAIYDKHKEIIDQKIKEINSTNLPNMNGLAIKIPAKKSDRIKAAKARYEALVELEQTREAALASGDSNQVLDWQKQRGRVFKEHGISSVSSFGNNKKSLDLYCKLSSNKNQDGAPQLDRRSSYQTIAMYIYESIDYINSLQDSESKKRALDAVSTSLQRELPQLSSQQKPKRELLNQGLSTLITKATENNMADRFKSDWLKPAQTKARFDKEYIKEITLSDPNQTPLKNVLQIAENLNQMVRSTRTPVENRDTLNAYRLAVHDLIIKGKKIIEETRQEPARQGEIADLNRLTRLLNILALTEPKIKTKTRTQNRNNEKAGSNKDKQEKEINNLSNLARNLSIKMKNRIRIRDMSISFEELENYLHGLKSGNNDKIPRQDSYEIIINGEKATLKQAKHNLLVKQYEDIDSHRNGFEKSVLQMLTSAQDTRQREQILAAIGQEPSWIYSKSFERAYKELAQKTTKEETTEKPNKIIKKQNIKGKKRKKIFQSSRRGNQNWQQLSTRR